MSVYVERIIERARRQTLNEVDSNDTAAGLSDEHFLDYINDALYRVQSILVPVAPEFFETSEIISLVANQREYNLSGDAFLGGHEVHVEYSDTGALDDYYPISRGTYFDISSERIDGPCRYYVRDAKILLGPTPSSGTGKVRCTYVRTIDRADKRRATIASNNDTTITVNDDSVLDIATINNADYICIVNKFGVVQNYALPVTSASGTTVNGTFTGLTFSAGDYIVTGKYASSHIDGPSNWERYITKYACREILANQDSSVDVQQSDVLLAGMEADIMNAALHAMNSGVQYVPVVNSFYT